MIELPCRTALLDVEGTTSSVAFVYEVMFPYARRELVAYVARHWDDEAMLGVRERFAGDAGDPAVADAPAALAAEAARLMDADVKATGLKQLQGLIWEAGFHSGELRAHLFDDVAPALRAWRDAGVGLRVYSSGSVHAQRLFFGHTEAGDLTGLFSGHDDTTTGPKREAASYAKIAERASVPAERIAFFSDVTEELDAARTAGMATVLVRRPGNAEPTPAEPPHPAIGSFDEVFWR